MRRSVRLGTIAAAAVALLMGGVLTGAAQDKLALIKTRQDFMKAQGADMKTINDYSKGKADQQAALKAVDDLLARAPKIDSMFVPGTSSADFPGKTRAKPEIWTDWDKAKLIPAKVESAEEQLKAAIEKGDAAAAGKVAGDVNRNGCNSCHGPYRLTAS